jgi:hypothetical protein
MIPELGWELLESSMMFPPKEDTGVKLSHFGIFRWHTNETWVKSSRPLICSMAGDRGSVVRSEGSADKFVYE